MSQIKIPVVVPTYKESNLLIEFLSQFCAASETEENFEIIVINAGEDKKTSSVCKLSYSGCTIHEILAPNDSFWSNSVNLGIKFIRNHLKEFKHFVIANVDVRFSRELLTELCCESKQRLVIAPVCHNGSLVISSGMRVNNWLICSHEHPLVGLSKVPGNQIHSISVDFLPTRLTVFPKSVIDSGYYINSEILPHYHADYEYTSRLKKHGYELCIIPRYVVTVDERNTGNNVYVKHHSFYKRITSAFSIKSEHEPFTRTAFVVLTYPSNAILTASLMYLGKTILEILVGGHLLKKFKLIK